MTTRRNWLAVASAEHVRIGRAQGFMQVNHGKAAPLRRLSPGDRIVYYSPTEKFRAADGYKAFTAIGTIKPGPVYQGVMGGGFLPWRRDVAWLAAQETPIAPLMGELALTSVRNWGYQLRFGLIEIGEDDMQRIAVAMGAALP